MNDPSSEVRNSRWPLVAIIAALVLWALFLGLGAYWAPSGEQAGHDRRKLLVVAATTGGFLAMWAIALWLGRRRWRAGSSRARTNTETGGRPSLRDDTRPPAR